MAERPAVDASPLIFLSRAGLLDLLQLASSEVVVPEPVATEISRRGSEDPAAAAGMYLSDRVLDRALRRVDE